MVDRAHNRPRKDQLKVCHGNKLRIQQHFRCRLLVMFIPESSYCQFQCVAAQFIFGKSSRSYTDSCEVIGNELISFWGWYWFIFTEWRKLSKEPSIKNMGSEDFQETPFFSLEFNPLLYVLGNLKKDKREKRSFLIWRLMFKCKGIWWYFLLEQINNFFSIIFVGKRETKKSWGQWSYHVCLGAWTEEIRATHPNNAWNHVHILFYIPSLSSHTNSWEEIPSLLYFLLRSCEERRRKSE